MKSHGGIFSKGGTIKPHKNFKSLEMESDKTFNPGIFFCV